MALAPAGEEEDFVFVGAGTASSFALAGAAALPVAVEDTGVTARPGADEVEPAGGGGAAGFGSGWPAACPAGADAGWARAAVTLGELPPSNSSGPALARISFTWPGFVRNGECGKSSPGRCFRTSLINCIQMGSATRAPSSFSPSVWWSSKPTYTPQVRDGVKPRNHASVKSLVVPVLPAIGYFWASDLARTAVPELKTSRNIETMRRATEAGRTSVISG